MDTMAITHVKNVAIVGSGGNCGQYITATLLKTGKHTITAISRSGSKSTLPDGVNVKCIDYEQPSTIVDALRGQDALVITLNPMGLKQQPKLIQAAADAGVPWILPNEWSFDTRNEKLNIESGLGNFYVEARDQIKKLGKSSYIAVSTGFWYEWSLSIPTAYGVDLGKRSVTYYDDGEVPLTTTTWPQVGRAVASLLSLPLGSTDGKPSLETYRNNHVFVKSFTLTQKDMYESAKRVTKTQDSDWSITHESTQERWSSAFEKLKGGDFSALTKVMYTRAFFPEEPLNNEKHNGVSNEVLGLPVEDIDAATQAAYDRFQATSGKGYS